VQEEQHLVQHLDTVNRVVGEYLKGNDPTKISKQLDLPRTKVVSLIKEVPNRQRCSQNPELETPRHS